MTDQTQVTVVYRLQCAAMTRGCLSAIAIDGPPGIDVYDLDREVPEDRRIRDLLHMADWRMFQARWFCGNHAMPSAPVVDSRRSLENLIELTEKHLEESLKAGAWGAAYVRLRRENCAHEWHQTGPFKGHDDGIDCTKCGLQVLDGYRPYYPKREEQEPAP